MFKNFVNAARLRTLPLSVSGIIVGTGLAISENKFNGIIFTLALLTTIGFQIISNFANDYGDGVKGTDNEERIGPKRALQSGKINPKQMKLAIIITSVITFFIALFLIYIAFGKNDFLNITIFLILGIASIAAAIKYTVGNSAYGYYGFGDVFVLLFFGFLSVLGSYYLYTKQLNYLAILPSITVGSFSVGVLNLNNMRDRESDIKSNKKTLAVKLGGNYAKKYHFIILYIGVLSSFIYSYFTANSVSDFLYTIAFIPLFIHLKKVANNRELKNLDPELKKLAIITFIYSVLFLIGINL